ncbi:MAG: hydroxymethylglutaryl-CoA reductase [Acidobacteriota bacterium]|nr:hydroxymethylglutaryl-CoA reductase [Acidobacteriota bacterium]
MKIPSMLLKRMYTFGTLKNDSEGVRFSLKNRLSDARLFKVNEVSINGKSVDLGHVTIQTEDGTRFKAPRISQDHAIDFPLRKVIHLRIGDLRLDKGKHSLTLKFDSDFGSLAFSVKDALSEKKQDRVTVPLSTEDDYSEAAIKERRTFIEKYSGAKLEHLPKYSFDPHMLAGNCEGFTGVAQVPVGFAGPIKVKGEYADGEFVIPLATTEGTLVASYNRGIKVLNLSGGVTTTVHGDAMQRAPVFVFETAREARAFNGWVDENIDKIREEAEATSSVAKLQYIDTFLSNRFAYLRFNYSTGDAAGQNMVGRATFAACSWILDHAKDIKKFYLESNLATDKKHSQINIMRTRGKRVTAEAVLKRDVLIEHMRTEPESLHYHGRIANIGAMLSGANNNGAHSPNGITAMFIATGQDVANVSESSAAILYSELTPEGDLYISITIPSLIVATYGGGTGLATQRECLEVLGCFGRDKVRKLAEIVSAVVLAGEVSLGSAISSLDWVSSHEAYGRNR